MAITLLFFSILVFSQNLQADHQNLYSLPKLGTLAISSENIDDIQIAGIVVGLKIDSSLYFETELNMTISGGKYVNARERGILIVSNLNFFGVYRKVFNKRFYGKLKAGIAYKSLDYQVSNNIGYDKTDNSTGLAGGIGVGLVYFLDNEPVMIELEYSSVDKNIDIITIGMTYPF